MHRDDNCSSAGMYLSFYAIVNCVCVCVCGMLLPCLSLISEENNNALVAVPASLRSVLLRRVRGRSVFLTHTHPKPPISLSVSLSRLRLGLRLFLLARYLPSFVSPCLSPFTHRPIPASCLVLVCPDKHRDVASLMERVS